MAVAKRYKKPWKQPKPLNDGVTSVLSKMSLDQKLVDIKVREAWREAVGEGFARRAAPTELIGSTLHVVVESPAWAHELRFLEKDIVDRVNLKYRELAPGSGASPVKRLKMHRGVLPALPPPPKAKDPLPKPTPEESWGVEDRLRDVKDPEIREAARRLLIKGVVANRDR